MIYRAKYDGLHEIGDKTESRFVIMGEVAARTGINLVYPPGLSRDLVAGETIYVARVNNNASDYILVGVERETVADVHLDNDKNDVTVKEDGTVELSGNDYGGLVKWEELQTQLEKVSDYLKGIKYALSDAVTATQDGGATYKANVVAGLKSLELPDYSEVESEMVLHGSGAESEEENGGGEESGQVGQDSEAGTGQNEGGKSNRHLVNSEEGSPEGAEQQEVVWKAMKLSTSSQGSAFIKGYERFRPNPYRATAGGNWTVGYGHEIDAHAPERFSHIEGFTEFYQQYQKDRNNPANIGIVDGKTSITIVRISETMALAIFEKDIESLEEGINKGFEGGKPDSTYALRELGNAKAYSSGRHLRQCEFDALVSFGFNTSRDRVLNASFFQTVQSHEDFDEPNVQSRILADWQKHTGGDRILRGLIRRRKDEMEMFFRGQYGINPANIETSFVALTARDLANMPDLGGPVPARETYLIPQKRGGNTDDRV